MTVTIAGVEFDNVTYDEDGDVLYLSVGEPQIPAESLSTPEGHNVRYDDAGQLVALTLVNPRYLLEREGKLRVTLPAPMEETEIRAALEAAAQ
jgi:uncharacterized protein YuzE